MQKTSRGLRVKRQALNAEARGEPAAIGAPLEDIATEDYVVLTSANGRTTYLLEPAPSLSQFARSATVSNHRWPDLAPELVLPGDINWQVELRFAAGGEPVDELSIGTGPERVAVVFDGVVVSTVSFLRTEDRRVEQIEGLT